MGGALVWTLLLLLVLQEAETQEYSCPVFSGSLNGTDEFTNMCLNFSHKNLSQPQNLSLFFKNLGMLQFLNVTSNFLDHVDGALAARCDLDLRAVCGCVQAVWHEVQPGNCSDQPSSQCQDVDVGVSRKLSAFLEARCPPGLTPGIIVGLAVSGCLLLGLVIAAPVLAWRLWRRQAGSSCSLGKAKAAKDDSKSSLGWQPRYSSRGLTSNSPVVTDAPDYENMFIGEQPAEHQLAEHGDPSAEEDFYMNYEGTSQNSQLVYCNLASLGMTPWGKKE